MTNEEVRNRIQNAIGVHDDLLTMVKKRKLRWYGHISRSSGMAKTILQGTVKGLLSASSAKPSRAQTYKFILMSGLRHPEINLYQCQVSVINDKLLLVPGLRHPVLSLYKYQDSVIQ